MKKTNALWIVLDLIFLILFNVVFFVAGGTDHNSSVWISYGFIHFAYLMLVLSPMLIRKGKSGAVFGFSIYTVSSFYFFLELVVGVVLILLSPESYKAALLIQIIIAGIYGIVLVAHMIANEHTADAEEQRQYEIAYVKDASAQLKGLLDRVSDKEAKKKVEKAYDAVYSSPVKSHPNMAQIENQILQSIAVLGNEVAAGNNARIMQMADELVAAANERNMRLKTLN